MRGMCIENVSIRCSNPPQGLEHLIEHQQDKFLVIKLSTSSLFNDDVWQYMLANSADSRDQCMEVPEFKVKLLAFVTSQ